MAAVLRLVPPRSEASVAALSELLELAVGGQLSGISCSYMLRGLEEEHVTTGIYRERPAEAVRAALRASIILTETEEPG